MVSPLSQGTRAFHGSSLYEDEWGREIRPPNSPCLQDCGAAAARLPPALLFFLKSLVPASNFLTRCQTKLSPDRRGRGRVPGWRNFLCVR